ncbi:MAG TPA: serine/threonine-protein kinase [Polyangiaceae bacterium]|jgi:serine/threonine-protein kinase
METHLTDLPSEIGRYRIVRILGRGAMGRVLLAHDPVLDREVAVKLLRDDLNIPEDQLDALLRRMRQEARASARVSHPNVIALHDMGEDPNLGLFLVFEYAEGATLKERILRGGLGAESAAKLAREIGAALTSAHSVGVLHRDIKPENIILTATGAKIADFGIARVPDSTLTRQGGLLGTPAYSAPESVATGAFSPLSDQFSLAVTLYEAISGERAFPGEDAVAVATRITSDEPPPIAQRAGVDVHVDRVLARALAKDPSNRFESAEAFAQALAEALVKSPRSALPTLPDEHHPRSSDARTTRLVVGAAAAGALIGITGFQLSTGLREPERGPAERMDSVSAAAPAAELKPEQPRDSVLKSKLKSGLRRDAREHAGRDGGAASTSATDAGTERRAASDAGRAPDLEP